MSLEKQSSLRETGRRALNLIAVASATLVASQVVIPKQAHASNFNGGAPVATQPKESLQSVEKQLENAAELGKPLPIDVGNVVDGNGFTGGVAHPLEATVNHERYFFTMNYSDGGASLTVEPLPANMHPIGSEKIHQAAVSFEEDHPVMVASNGKDTQVPVAVSAADVYQVPAL